MPIKNAMFAFAIFGFILPFLEPCILLLLGDDLGGAFWPMALRTLDLTLFLRENRSIIFGLLLIYSIHTLLSGKSENTKVRLFCSFIIGLVFGLIVVFILLDLAYLSGAFVLLPTIYGFLIAITSFKIFGKPDNIFKSDNNKFVTGGNYVLILIAVYLISPGLQAFAGLAPSPPEFESPTTKFSIETNIHQYPMPQEVENIRGDIEGDIDFSIYIISPESKNDEIYPLAILLHGFANPGYSTYKDWSETLASRGVAVAFIQYPSDVWPEGHDTYVLHEEGGMSNHPFHVPRTQALYSALDFLTTILPQNVNPDNLLVGGHSLGAGYAFIALEWALNYGWGNSSLFVDLEAPYARPVQEDLQVNLSKIPDRFMAHIAISEDDMSVSDCFGVHHQQKLGHGAILLEIPSDRHGYPRMVASHYLQASETHDALADWGFYRRVSYQADWLYGIQTNDIQLENTALQNLVESPELTYMGEWSDGKKVKQISVYQDALNSTAFNYCKSWTGP